MAGLQLWRLPRHGWDIVLKWRCRSEARRLAPAGEPAARALQGALAAAVGSANPDSGEAARFARIDALRERLSASPLVLSVHGAARTVGTIAQKDAISPVAGRLLFALIRAFRPSVCIELGTSLGLSAAYQAGALALNGSGRLETIDSEPALARLAEQNLAELGLHPAHARVWQGHGDMVLPQILEEARPAGGFGYAFVDGDHRGDRTLAQFERLAAAAAGGAVLVFDDIRYTRSMHAAWRQIRSDRRVVTSADLVRLGIVVLAKDQPALTPPSPSRVDGTSGSCRSRFSEAR